MKMIDRTEIVNEMCKPMWLHYIYKFDRSRQTILCPLKTIVEVWEDGPMNGYRSDGISYPAIIRWIPCYSNPLRRPYLFAAIRHDWMYNSHVYTRRTCDSLFRDALIKLGMSRSNAWLHWIGVRLFGWYRWGKGGILVHTTQEGVV